MNSLVGRKLYIVLYSSWSNLSLSCLGGPHELTCWQEPLYCTEILREWPFVQPGRAPWTHLLTGISILYLLRPEWHPLVQPGRAPWVTSPCPALEGPMNSPVGRNLNLVLYSAQWHPLVQPGRAPWVTSPCPAWEGPMNSPVGRNLNHVLYSAQSDIPLSSLGGPHEWHPLVQPGRAQWTHLLTGISILYCNPLGVTSPCPAREGPINLPVDRNLYLIL